MQLGWVTCRIATDVTQQQCQPFREGSCGPQSSVSVLNSAIESIKRTFARRAKIANKFITGEWSADLDGFEAAKATDRAAATTLSEQCQSLHHLAE